MDIVKARDFSPTQGSLTMICGPPGMGKSWAAGTMAEYLDPSEVLLIATLPREVNSAKYQQHNLDTVVLSDDDWMPDQERLVATGYDELIKILRDLIDDTDYGGIILDNGTEAGEMAWHASLAPLGVSDPNELGRGGNRFAPYTSIREKMEQLISSLSLLTGKTGKVARPKLIAVPWHVQPPKETTGDDDSADEKGKGAEYEGDYLPMVRGSFRRRIGGKVDAVIYADCVSVRVGDSFKSEETYVLQVVRDRERHVKLPGVVPEDADLLKDKYIHNNWSDYMDLLEVLDLEEDNG